MVHVMGARPKRKIAFIGSEDFEDWLSFLELIEGAIPEDHAVITTGSFGIDKMICRYCIEKGIRYVKIRNKDIQLQEMLACQKIVVMPCLDFPRKLINDVISKTDKEVKIIEVPC